MQAYIFDASRSNLSGGPSGGDAPKVLAPEQLTAWEEGRCVGQAMAENGIVVVKEHVISIPRTTVRETIKMGVGVAVGKFIFRPVLNFFQFKTTPLVGIVKALVFDVERGPLVGNLSGPGFGQVASLLKDFGMASSFQLFMSVVITNIPGQMKWQFGPIFADPERAFMDAARQHPRASTYVIRFNSANPEGVDLMSLDGASVN